MPETHQVIFLCDVDNTLLDMACSPNTNGIYF